MAVDSIKYGYQELANRYELSTDQLQQLQTYAQMLVEWNNRMNLTALCQPHEILAYHFWDSLEIIKFHDLASSTMLADVGTGAGFPALPLKIKYPQLPMTLIEVSSKRILFLREVIAALGLSNVEIIDLDWRTFLRKIELPIDVFIARASLAPQELVRIFKSHSPYRDAQLIYWASLQWQADEAVAPFIVEQHTYDVGDKQRQYVCFKKSS